MGKGTAYFEKKKSYMYWKKIWKKNMQILFFLYGWKKTTKNNEIIKNNNKQWENGVINPKQKIVEKLFKEKARTTPKKKIIKNKRQMKILRNKYPRLTYLKQFGT